MTQDSASRFSNDLIRIIDAQTLKIAYFLKNFGFAAILTNEA